MSEAPSLSASKHDGRSELRASGSWTAAHAGELETLIEQSAAEASKARNVSIDMRDAGAFDTYGAWLLERLVRERAAAGQQTEVVALREEFRGILQDMHRVGLERKAGGAEKKAPLLSIKKAEQAIAAVGRSFLAFVHMLGAIGVGAIRTVQHPRSFRLTSAVYQLDRVGWQATPIILLITFLIGCIIAQQGFFHFRKFGAENYVVDMVGILILREIGVLLVAIMVAGRSGSSYTAELGSMKMREEIDALRTMGLDPVEVLLLPRVLALIIALPILMFLGSMAALFGGGLVALAL